MKKVIAALYILLLVVMAAATMVESAWGTSAAHAWIYGSWWFCLLWGLLAAAGLVYFFAVRRVRRAGVVALHLSLVLILIGALLTHLTSRQGMMHLRTGRPTDTYTTVTSGNDTTEVTLPFSLRLDRFETRYHAGTQTAADWLSRFTVIDGTERMEAQVSMNKIFTYRSVRFYQSSYDDDGRGSWLSVNTDPWGIPVTYTGYALLFLSLLWMLVSPHGSYRRLLRSPLLKRGALVAMLLTALAPALHAQPTLPRETADRFGRLYMLSDGRICPVQTFAVDFCKKVYGARSYRGLTAEQVLTGWMFYGEEWSREPFVKVKRGPLRTALQLPGHCSVASFFEAGEPIDVGYRLAPYVREYYDGQHDKFHQQAMDIDERLQLVMLARRGDLLRVLPYVYPHNYRATRRDPFIKSGTVTWFSPVDPLPAAVEHQHALYFRQVFPLIYMDVKAGLFDRVDVFFDKMLRYQRLTVGGSLPGRWQTRAERMNNAVPFATVLFMVNLTLGFLALFYFVCTLTRHRRVRALDVALPVLLALSLLALTLALALRWVAGGHVPMGNGYETMLTLAWLVQLIALLLCRRFRVVLVFGFLLSGFFLLVSHINAMDPAIGRMMPVLDSPLLSLHVGVVMTSYALLSLTFVCAVTGLLLRSHAAELQALSRVFLYPAVATLAIGIFLGAVWANVSWGTYWSWDPKETWALVTFMLYAVPLHEQSLPRLARPAAYHLYMALAFLAVVMTYFGVNYFLAGMHSYA